MRTASSDHAKKYVAYYRVSTDKQGERGLGIQAQRDAVGRFIDSQGATLFACYTEVETGTRKGTRPGLAEALALTASIKGTLVIAKLDRLARNVGFINKLMDSTTDFIALDFPEANRLVLHIMAAVAEHEAKIISERTSAAIQAKIARGAKWGNPQNLKPEYSALSRADAAMARETDARAFADKMYPTLSFYLQNRYSLNKIASEMNRLKYSTPSGLIGKWTATTVRNCLAWSSLSDASGNPSVKVASR